MKRVIVVLLVLLTMSLTTSCNKGGESKQLQMSGSYYDNFADFKGVEHEADVNESVESISCVTKSYLQNVTYEIKKLDKENKVATLEVSVPNFTQVLPQIVSNVLTENENVAYEELLEIVQSELEKTFSNESVEKTKTIIDMSIEEIDGEYKLVYNEQWEQIVFGSLENMYIEYYRTMIGGLKFETMK